MNHQPPPLITVPLDLSDEAEARLIDFLLEIAHRMENHYSERRHYSPSFSSYLQSISLEITKLRACERGPTITEEHPAEEEDRRTTGTHAKRVLSLANATLGVPPRPRSSHLVHGVKQVDRLLSNQTMCGNSSAWVP